MSCTWCWFSCIRHSSACVIILIKKCGLGLWDTQILQYTTDKQYCFPCIISTHKFCLGRWSCYSGSETSFPCNCTTGQAKAHACKGTPGLQARCPIRVNISYKFQFSINWPSLRHMRSCSLLLTVGSFPRGNDAFVVDLQKYMPSDFVWYRYFSMCLTPL